MERDDASVLKIGYPFLEPLTPYVEPASAFLPIGHYIVYNVYDRLVELERDADGRLSVVPSLAESWWVSDDGGVYSFKLRPDARFASGEPVTADAVKFSLERIVKTAMPPSRFLPLEEVRVTGELTFDLVLRRSTSTLPTVLCTPLGSIVDPSVIELGDDIGYSWLSHRSAGSGPFVVEEMSDERVVLRANPTHWRGAPRLKQVIIDDRPDPAEQRMALEQGDIDLSLSISAEDFKELAGNPAFAGHRPPSFCCPYVTVLRDAKGHDGELLARNLKFTEAIKHALDYDAYADLYGGWGDGVDACQAGVLPGMPGFDPSLARYFTYDPGRARKLLAEAGYPDGIELGFPYQDGYWGAVHTTRIASQVQRDLATIGISTTLQMIDVSDYFGPPPTERPVRSLSGISITMSAHYFPDPDEVLRRHMTRDGDEYNALAKFDQAAVESDPAARGPIYLDLQNQYVRETPSVFLLTYPNNVVRRSTVTGYSYPVNWSGPSLHKLSKG